MTVLHILNSKGLESYIRASQSAFILEEYSRSNSLKDSSRSLKTKEFYSAEYVEFVNGFHFKINCFLYLEPQMYIKIEKIFKIENNAYFLCLKYKKHSFENLINMFTVIKTNDKICLKYDDIVFKKPFECYEINNKMFILQPYFY